MFRIQSLVRGALLLAAVALISVPSLAKAHHGGCFPTVSHCHPYYTPYVAPCYKPLVYSQPLFTQPCVRPIYVQPCIPTYSQPCYSYGGSRIIIR
jgi:hypothetical protein